MPPKQRSHGSGSRKPTNARQPTNRSGGNSLLIGGIVVAAAVIASGLAFFALGNGSGNSETNDTAARAALKDAGCTLQVAKATSREHLTNPAAKLKWNTNPPTNGPHYYTPAIWGAYTAPIQTARYIHNLEHGGIYMQYGRKVSPATVAQLQAFYADHTNGTLLMPLPSLGNKIALGAWVSPPNGMGSGYLAKCPSFDQRAFDSFFSAYQFKGPERFPASSLTPGT